MKKDIHPKYNQKASVKCACGNSFEVGSTLDEIKPDLCSACHPFYTGKQKLVDTARRVEKFEAKMKAQKSLSGTGAGKKARRAKRDEKKDEDKKKVEKQSK